MWEVVGLIGPEERVYDALIPHQSCTTADVADKTGLTKARAARILARLVDRGMVTRLQGRPARFVAVRPDLAASQLIAAQERRLGQLRTYAQRAADSYRSRPYDPNPAELVEVVEGASNVRRAFVRLQREAKTQMRVFDKPPYTGEQPEGNLEEYRLLDEGRIDYRTLYDKAAFAEPGRMAEIRKGIRRGERARVATLPMKMALSDDQLALIPVLTSGFTANQAAYVIHPSSLLDALSELFEVMWASAIPLNQSPISEKGRDPLTDQDRDLLGLLAAGSTDEMMARTFGCSVRTVQRYVRRIMTLVGAQTRFQAGLEASRRGWILGRVGLGWVDGAVVRRLGDHRSARQRSVTARAMPGREHRTTSWPSRRKPRKAHRSSHVIVDGLHAPAHEVGLMPKARAARVLVKVLPPAEVDSLPRYSLDLPSGGDAETVPLIRARRPHLRMTTCARPRRESRR